MINFTKPPLGTPLNPSHRLNQGLVLYMPFSEGAGSTTQDLSGKGNHGTLTNMVQGATSGWTGGKFGGAMNFDGSDDYVNINPVNGFEASYTYSVWVMARALAPANSNNILSITDAGGTNHMILIETGDGTNNKVRFLHRQPAGGSGGDSFYSDKILIVNRWYHVVFTRDENKKMSIYIDGVFDKSIVGVAAAQGNVSFRALMGILVVNNFTRMWNGSISEVRIYNRALSAIEVQQLYSDPFCMYESKSLSRWAQLIKKGSFFFAKRF